MSDERTWAYCGACGHVVFRDDDGPWLLGTTEQGSSFTYCGNVEELPRVDCGCTEP